MNRFITLIFMLLYSQLFISCGDEDYTGNKTIQRLTENYSIENRVALVIGNDDYEVSKLKNAVKDAKKISEFLDTRGFKIIYEENVETKGELMKLINKFINSIRKDGVGLFYFSGHGMSSDNKNYIIPTKNSSINDDIDIKEIGLSINYLLGKLEKVENRLNIVMLDACRNSLGRGSSSPLMGDSAEGVYIAYATAEGERAKDNGLFASAFVESASIAGLRIEEVFKRVRKKLKRETGQIPFTTNGIIGDFYFTLDDSVIKTPEPTKTLKSIEDVTCNNPIECSRMAKEYRDNGSYEYAKKFYLKSCNLDSSIACNELGWIYKKVDGDYENAKKYYTKSCDMGYGLGCSNIGWFYEEGKFIKQNYDRALYFYKSGCELNDGYSCGNLAGMYYEGLGVQKNLTKAKKFYERGCSLGNKKSCLRLNELHTKFEMNREISSTFNMSREVKLTIPANNGNLDNYMKMAKKYKKERKFNKAKEFYLKACSLGDKVACNDLGWIYKKIDKDYKNAQKFYNKSCTLNYGLGCANIGWIYEEGKYIAKDYKKAVKLYKKGCDLNNGNSCSSLGGMYKDAKGVHKNIKKAKKFYEKACKLKNNYGCENLKKL